MGNNAFVQIFESTRDFKVGTKVKFTGNMLEVYLGPGILAKNFDGLQNDLNKMKGIFLKRGERTFPLENDKKWGYKPLAKAGDEVVAGDWLGEVDEMGMPHKIMVPFKFKGNYEVAKIKAQGNYTINETIAVLVDKEGNQFDVTMVQTWPVKIPHKRLCRQIEALRIILKQGSG